MPDAPTWDFIKQAADKMTDRANGVNGVCPNCGGNFTARPIRPAAMR